MKISKHKWGRIFITGSADGLGQLAAKSLIEKGHEVVLHARNAERGREAMKKNPEAKAGLTGDLSVSIKNDWKQVFAEN